MVNKVLDFFNKIAGIMIFLIFVVLFMEHIHHAHFRNGGHHRHIEVPANPADTARANTDPSAKK